MLFTKHHWFFLVLLSTLLLLGCSRENTAQHDQKHILFLGDTSFGENYQEKLSTNILEEKGYDYSLKNFTDILASADIAITNLETPLTNQRESELEEIKSYIHYSNPEKATETFAKFGMTIFSLANNHTLDMGKKGLKDTINAIEKNDMQYFGAGIDEEKSNKYFIHKIDDNISVVVIGAFEYRNSYDKKYGFYANEEEPGVNTLDVTEMAQQIKKIQTERPNALVVVFPHWGKNYAPTTPLQEKYARQMVDFGADLIIGHGAHVLQKTEKYKGKWILYSLGNFMFNSPGRYQKEDVDPFSLIADLVISNEKKYLRLYPIFTDNRITEYQSRFVTKEEFKRASKKLNGKKGQDNFGYFVEVEL